MSGLTYEELRLPYYVNNGTAVTLSARIAGRKDLINIYLSLTDAVFALELAGLNALFVSDTGRGKTQLITDIKQYHFGGDGINGKANWATGRPNFEIEDIFIRSKADLSKGVFDSEEVRKLKDDRIRRLFTGVDEINRAPKPKQNDCFDLADAKYNFNGENIRLGRDGYHLFFVTANLNKINGDFSGTYEFDRALLNRTHATIDLDHPPFRPTAADKIRIRKQKTSPHVDVAEPRDISDKILAVHKEIVSNVRFSPELLAFQFLVDDGLNYCQTGREHEKASAFPMLCGECSASGKNLCSLIKGSSERTVDALAPFAVALAYVAELKYQKELVIDPLDTALQAFKFTTYHGNLNDLVAREEYFGMKQMMMDSVIDKLGSAVTVLRDFFGAMRHGSSEILSYSDPKTGKVQRMLNSDELRQLLTEKNISFQERKMKTELNALGIGTSWIDEYIDEIKQK